MTRFKPQSNPPSQICSLEEFLNDVTKRSHLKPATVRRYAVKLRKMISDISGLEHKLSAAERRRKYDYVNGGRAAWLKNVGSQSLSILSAETITRWRNEYVNRAADDMAARKSAERSSASYIRCCRALFSIDVIKALKVRVPASPFAGVKLKDPGPARYRSEADAAALVSQATTELAVQYPETFLAFNLCFWAGLRRKEADLLRWAEVDLERGQIHVRRTEFFEPKTEESQRAVDLPSSVIRILTEFRRLKTGVFVLDGAEPDNAATYDYYRCNATWRHLLGWLKTKGIRNRKAVHALRKESGSLIAAAFGVEAARHHLGHRDIRTTSAHYLTKKARIEVTIPSATGPLTSLNHHD